MANENVRKPFNVNKPENQEEQVRLRAYQLYESRGREDGRDLEDWFRAEREIRTSNVRTIAA